MQRIEKLPIGFVATWLGLTTLSNIFNSLGFPALRYIAVYLGIFVLLAKFIKFLIYPKQCLEEYNNPILASLYPLWGMLMMLIGSTFVQSNYVIGKTIWSVGMIYHATLIIIFTIKHLLIKFDFHTFLPSWFVTYFGILVGTVSGENMNMPPQMINGLMIFGFILIPLLYIPMIFRVLCYHIPSSVNHTKGIFVAPISLVIITYITYGYADQNPLILKILAFVLLVGIIYILCHTYEFFSVHFTPIFAGLTFPTAIATLAMMKIEDFFVGTYIAKIANFVVGIMLFVTTVFIGHILFNFLKIVLVHPKKHHVPNNEHSVQKN
ncbi:MAG: hypothetical protein ACRCV0_05130 [Brevinema sp.]